MNLSRPARFAILSCSFVLLPGCAAFRTADADLDAASRQIVTDNMTLTADGSGVPKAAITPQGDFLVAGNPWTSRLGNAGKSLPIARSTST
ncbi:MAG TPA: hypothetical protein VHA71_04540 [Rhodanobacteraceae bacterium]|jgi:hypothetical protein|nr:hypothetical protein [Rhodanobacteraceae bacterium]